MHGRQGADLFGAGAWGSRISLILLIVLSACAPQRAPAPSGENTVVERDSGVTPGPFWELRLESDAPPRMYLLGSVHAASSDMFPLPPVIEQAFDDSDGLVVEVNLLGIDPERTRELVTRHGLLLGEETLEDLLPPEDLDNLRSALARHDMSLQNVERLRPWMVASMLEEAELAGLGYEFASGIDLYFLRRAAEGKKIVSLETFEAQLSMLSTLPPQLELRFLEEMLGDPAEIRKRTKELMDAWQRGDEAALEKAIFQDSDDPELAQLYDRLLFRRNASMAEQLEPLLEQPDTWFVVVGAGHFVGDRSVIAHLKQKGYDIRRVP